MNVKRVGVYLRVSTDEQTVENQRMVLNRVCEHRSWTIVEEFVDNGISGAKGRDKRPALDKLLTAVTRGKIDVVAAVSVDRLGRSVKDLALFIQELHSAGCDLYLDREALDTTSPFGLAMFQMAGVFAQLERSMIQGRVKAGMDRAKRKGTKSGKPIGRPTVAGGKLDEVRRTLALGHGILKTAKLCRVGVSVVQRVKAEVA